MCREVGNLKRSDGEPSVKGRHRDRARSTPETRSQAARDDVAHGRLPRAPQRIAILGLGLMGGSLGMALRASGRHVLGYDAAPGVAEHARARGAIDDACASVADAVAGADLIVLATPILAMRELLAALSLHAQPGAIVTDLGSSKAQIVGWANELLHNPERFVGGHPMTGREHSGVAAAQLELFDGCTWCLTPTQISRPETVRYVAELVEALGARVHIIDPERHDAVVALVSHLPLVVASALVLTASSAPGWLEAEQLAAGGFRDTTRVASGSPCMARDICVTNRAPLLTALDAYLTTLEQLRSQIAASDEALEDTFTTAKRSRDTCLLRSRARREIGGNL